MRDGALLPPSAHMPWRGREGVCFNGHRAVLCLLCWVYITHVDTLGVVLAFMPALDRMHGAATGHTSFPRAAPTWLGRGAAVKAASGVLCQSVVAAFACFVLCCSCLCRAVQQLTQDRSAAAEQTQPHLALQKRDCRGNIGIHHLSAAPLRTRVATPTCIGGENQKYNTHARPREVCARLQAGLMCTRV